MTNLEIVNAYVGTDQVEKIYLGADVIYSGSPGPTPSYPVVIVYDSLGHSSADTFSNGIIPNNQYQNRRDLVRVVIGSGITSIGTGNSSYAFAGCSHLTSATIGDDVEYIAGRAFENTPNLTEITIPASVTGIGTNAFYNFDWRYTITFEGDIPAMSMEEDGDLGINTNLIVPDIYLSNYCSFNSSHNNQYNIESDLGNECALPPGPTPTGVCDDWADMGYTSWEECMCAEMGECGSWVDIRDWMDTASTGGTIGRKIACIQGKVWTGGTMTSAGTFTSEPGRTGSYDQSTGSSLTTFKISKEQPYCSFKPTGTTTFSQAVPTTTTEIDGVTYDVYEFDVNLYLAYGYNRITQYVPRGNMFIMDNN